MADAPVELPEARPIRPEERAAWDALGQDHHSLGLLLLAQTFVDPACFTGTRYRAANWQVVGLLLL